MALVVGSTRFATRSNRCPKPKTIASVKFCGDVLPPTVAITLSPSDNPFAALPNTSFVVQFSEPVFNVTGDSFVLFDVSSNGLSTRLAATITYDSATWVATLTPVNPLLAGSGHLYSIFLSSEIADSCSNRLVPVAFRIQSL